jgi:predicted naringenin-chalcone synthase
MPYILDISTAVPEFAVTNQDLINFYSKALEPVKMNSIKKKLNIYSEKMKIKNRYSCITDFSRDEQELFTDEDYNQPVEKRMEVYKNKLMPLATQAIDKLLAQNNIESPDITHIITVNCTGLFAPGFEFLVSEHYGLQHTEKLAINFLGCYAAIKALKHAHYIAQAEPNACILIVSAELCSLHFHPSTSDEDIIANLLFADGAAAAIVCGNENIHIKNKVVLNIDAIGSAYIPNTLNLMTWNISSSAFRMYLHKNIVKTIKDNIQPVVNGFLETEIRETDFWAIHPGGVRIVEAVKESLNLSENNVADSMSILEEYGNMSSPTILFILNRILSKVRTHKQPEDKKIFACAFGPGLSIEMIRFTSADTLARKIKKSPANYVLQP